jgi:hypothetical protein
MEKPDGHIPTSLSCDSCHLDPENSNFEFVHAATSLGQSSTCHNDNVAPGKPADHLPTSANCSSCHNAPGGAWNSITMNHSAVTAKCESCHNGTTAPGKPANHFAAPTTCESCHTTSRWTPAQMDHTSVTGSCFTWSMRSDKYQMETVAVGSYEGDLTGEREKRTRTSALYFDFKDLDKTFATRWGRQSGNSGGVLGRFDGGKFSYLLTKKIRMNLVSGFPVNQSYDDLNTDKIFYGVNFDFGRFFDHWDFNTYVINQTADGIDDRRAVGTEVRYVDKQGSFFSLIDYDILFNELSIFLFAGNWLLPNDATRLNLSVDYRNNPILSTSNALIGQLSPSLEELKDSIGESALQKLAEDRTLRSSFVTLGASHTLSENLQFAGDVSWSKLDGAPASGGVEAMASTGDEFFYSTQVISNNFFRDGDNSTLGLRYADTKQRDTYSLILSSRQPIDDHWRLTPRLKIDYRDNKLQDGEQWRFRPGLRAEYFFNKQWRLDKGLGRRQTHAGGRRLVRT